MHLRFTLFKFIFQSFYSFCIGISAFFPGSLRLHFYSCNVKHVMDILQTSLFLLLSCGFIPVNLFPFSISFRLILDFGLFFGRIFTCEIYGWEGSSGRPLRSIYGFVFRSYFESFQLRIKRRAIPIQHVSRNTLVDSNLITEQQHSSSTVQAVLKSNEGSDRKHCWYGSDWQLALPIAISLNRNTCFRQIITSW